MTRREQPSIKFFSFTVGVTLL